VNGFGRNEGHLLLIRYGIHGNNMGQGLHMIPTNRASAEFTLRMGGAVTMPTVHKALAKIIIIDLIIGVFFPTRYLCESV
jgi:hypothetical protein